MNPTSIFHLYSFKVLIIKILLCHTVHSLSPFTSLLHQSSFLFLLAWEIRSFQLTKRHWFCLVQYHYSSILLYYIHQMIDILTLYHTKTPPPNCKGRGFESMTLVMVGGWGPLSFFLPPLIQSSWSGYVTVEGCLFSVHFEESLFFLWILNA